MNRTSLGQKVYVFREKVPGLSLFHCFLCGLGSQHCVIGGS